MGLCLAIHQMCYSRGSKTLLASGTTELGFPGGSVIKNPPANAGYSVDMGSISGSGRFPGGGHGNPLQYFWWVTVHKNCTELDMTEAT